MMQGMFHGNYGWFGMGWMGFFWLAVLVGCVLVAAVLVALWARRSPPRSLTPPSAEETLKDRYARGEIDTQEYQQRLRQLRA